MKHATIKKCEKTATFLCDLFFSFFLPFPRYYHHSRHTCRRATCLAKRTMAVLSAPSLIRLQLLQEEQQLQLGPDQTWDPLIVIIVSLSERASYYCQPWRDKAQNETDRILLRFFPLAQMTEFVKAYSFPALLNIDSKYCNWGIARIYFYSDVKRNIFSLKNVIYKDLQSQHFPATFF